ncbi:hypothetical protein [Fimbriiglobus ruber]|uniref:Uncharacterized protein n=1 Tax=Fimbriiglobus ruber TaxID=1908690 RepID=A0A225CYD8_9BACT|nr:hypothetical protein [Fimbriiglobus ruber]OWK34252.1 hypothetical protein FRUB_10223 [Fimbriiglobus ruber]
MIDADRLDDTRRGIENLIDHAARLGNEFTGPHEGEPAEVANIYWALDRARKELLTAFNGCHSLMVEALARSEAEALAEISRLWCTRPGREPLLRKITDGAYPRCMVGYTLAPDDPHVGNHTERWLGFGARTYMGAVAEAVRQGLK